MSFGGFYLGRPSSTLWLLIAVQVGGINAFSQDPALLMEGHQTQMGLIQHFDVVIKGEVMTEAASGEVAVKQTAIRWINHPTLDYEFFVMLSDGSDVATSGRAIYRTRRTGGVWTKDEVVVVQDGLQPTTLPRRKVLFRQFAKLPEWRLIGAFPFPPAVRQPKRLQELLSGTVIASSRKAVSVMPDGRIRTYFDGRAEELDRNFTSYYDPSTLVHVGGSVDNHVTGVRERSTRYEYGTIGGFTVPIKAVAKSNKPPSTGRATGMNETRAVWTMTWLSVGENASYETRPDRSTLSNTSKWDELWNVSTDGIR